MWSATFVHEMFYLSYVSLMGPDRADPRHHTSTTNITTTTNTNSTWAQVMYWSCGKTITLRLVQHWGCDSMRKGQCLQEWSRFTGKWCSCTLIWFKGDTCDGIIERMKRDVCWESHILHKKCPMVQTTHWWTTKTTQLYLVQINLEWCEP